MNTIDIIAFLLDKINDMKSVQNIIKEFGKKQGKNLAEEIPGDKIEKHAEDFLDLFLAGFKEGFTSDNNEGN